MLLRKCLLEENIEAIRGQMERAAGYLGRNHPKVYELSCMLDDLHNEWGRITGLKIPTSMLSSSSYVRNGPIDYETHKTFIYHVG